MNSVILPVRLNRIWVNGEGKFDFAIVTRLQHWPDAGPRAHVRLAEIGHHFPTLYEWREPALTAEDIGQFLGGN